jgi:PAS domain-containing protein
VSRSSESKLEAEAMSGREAIWGDVEDAIGRVRVPAYMIDRDGIIRWLNPAARKLVGDVPVVRLGQQRRPIDADGERIAVESVPFR